MYKVFLVFVSVVISGLAFPQGHDPMAKPAGFDPKRDAAKDIANAVKLAQKQNKRILIDVGGEW